MFNPETVRYVSTSSIQPCSQAAATTRVDIIDLNPWDLKMLPFPYMQRGFLYSDDIQHQRENPVDVMNHLKISFTKTLENFYPLAGRLAIRKNEDDDEEETSISIFIDCKNSTVHEYFFPLNGALNHEEISRGATNVDRPVLERCFFDTDSPIRIPISTFQLLRQRFPRMTSPLEERIFHFEQESIATLKAKANLGISTTTTTVSSLQALFAHIWLATTRARKLDPNEETSLWLSIGNRSRMNPPLPEAYLGNSMQHGVATAKAGELLEKGLGWAALLLNQVIASYDNEKVVSIWKSWVVKPSFMFTGNSPPPKNILVSGGSPRFNVYDNDFGWGKPVAVRTGRSSHYDGRVIPTRGLVAGSI
ncbi:hypothetical protein MKW92_005404 [Papaver armeniacum]|nr:hypothetical protein MKW92_005404 [Papaver armeniacum]